MKISGFKRVKNISFVCQNKMFFYSKDILLNNDLSTFFENLYGGKKVSDYFIFENNDFLEIQKGMKVIVVPSVFDFEKCITSGQKSIIIDIIINLIHTSKYSSDTLVTIRKLIETLDIRSEIDSLNNILSTVENNNNIKFEIDILENLENIITNSLVFKVLKNDNELNNDNISFYEMKRIYISLIEWLIKLNDNSFTIIFKDVFYGLNIEESAELQEMINNIDSYVCICSYLPTILDENVKYLNILENDNSYCIGELLNNSPEYEYFIDGENIENVINLLIKKWILWSPIYGDEWNNNIELSKNEKSLYLAYINRN